MRARALFGETNMSSNVIDNQDDLREFIGEPIELAVLKANIWGVRTLRRNIIGLTPAKSHRAEAPEQRTTH